MIGQCSMRKVLQGELTLTYKSLSPTKIAKTRGVQKTRKNVKLREIIIIIINALAQQPQGQLQAAQVIIIIFFTRYCL
jgi:hypothetical protein